MGDPLVFFENTYGAIEYYGKIRANLVAKGQPIGPNDFLIAAIALANHKTLVTHNTREFSRIEGLIIIDFCK